MSSCHAAFKWTHHRRYLHPDWSQYASALAKQSKLPSFICFLWIIGEATSLKQASQRDELISSGPQINDEAFSHSLWQLIHLTRNLFMACTTHGAPTCSSARHRYSHGSFALCRKDNKSQVTPLVYDRSANIKKGPICSRSRVYLL